MCEGVQGECVGVLRFKITEQGVCMCDCRERVCVWGVLVYLY